MSGLRIAVLISGSGRTLKNLIEARAAGVFQAELPLVISSNPKATGLQYADLCEAEPVLVDHAAFESTDAFSERIFQLIELHQCNFIVMAGFMRMLNIPESWNNRVVNIHPSLVPMFCGKGYYGIKVHQAAVDYGVKISGCTVHFVDNHFDNGPVILQKTVPVYAEDTARNLADRVLQAEFQALPEALKLIADGRVHVTGRIVHIDGVDG